MKAILFAVITFGVGILIGTNISTKNENSYTSKLINLQDSALHMSDSIMSEYNLWDVMEDDYSDQYYRVRAIIDSLLDEGI